MSPLHITFAEMDCAEANLGLKAKSVAELTEMIRAHDNMIRRSSKAIAAAARRVRREKLGLLPETNPYVG